jgi:hypothetical protein
MPIISGIRKRLIPIFKAKKAIPRPEEKVENGGASEGLVEKSKGITGKAITDESGMPSPTGYSPNHPLETQKSGVLFEPISHFETSELILEIKANSATARTPLSGKLIPFKTGAWDHRSSEEDFLPAGAMKELDEAYVYIRLANKLVWLSEDLGRSSQDIGENYLKICTNISEHLDMAMSLVKVETEEYPKPQETIKVEVEGNLGANETGVEKPAAGPAAKVEFDATDKLLFLGEAKLFIAKGTHGVQIAALMDFLNGTQDIRVLSSGGAVGERSWVILSLDRSLPLLQILRAIPITKLASLRGNDIEVTLVST